MEEQKRRRERKSAAYWLSKSSILYPICILYVMYVKQVEVYITECSVHISSGTMLFAYALCLILWLASPIRSYCADGTANEVLFYAFPPSILMLFLFAQYSLKQTEMRLSHFFLISRIFSENIFVFICPIFTENCVVSCSAGWDISCYGFKRFT